MPNLFATEESKHTYLVNRGAKGEIRCYEFWYEEVDGAYIIHRESCQYRGKVTEQPSITITEGKVKRDAEAQCILQITHFSLGYNKLKRILFLC